MIELPKYKQLPSNFESDYEIYKKYKFRKPKESDFSEKDTYYIDMFLYNDSSYRGMNKQELIVIYGIEKWKNIFKKEIDYIINHDREKDKHLVTLNDRYLEKITKIYNYLEEYDNWIKKYERNKKLETI